MANIALLLATCAVLTSIYVLWHTLFEYHKHKRRVERLEHEWMHQRRIYKQWYIDATDYEARYADLHKMGNYVEPIPPPLLR